MRADPFHYDEHDPAERQPGAGGAENPLRWIHRSLRGRYHWTAALGLCLAIPGALIGYNLLPPVFTSSGFIEIAPTLQTTLYTLPDSGVPPMYDSFVSTQATYLTSARVLSRAIESERMRAIAWPTGPEGVSALSSSLSVLRRRGQQVIQVSVTHREAPVAQIAANSVMDAYMEIYADQSALSITARERELDLRVQRQRRDLQSIRESINRIARDYGGDNLDAFHQAGIDRQQRLESEIAELQMRLGAIEAQVPGDPGAPIPGTPTVDQLAEVDLELKDLLNRRRNVEKLIEINRAKYGPSHRQMQDLNRQQEALVRLIAERTDTLLREIGLSPDAPGAGLSGRVSQFRTEIARRSQELQKVTAEVRDLGAKRVEIGLLREQEAEARKLLNEAASALEKVRTERPNLEQGRISVAQRGELPTRPSNDRRLALAGAGGAAGLGIGVGAIGLLGFLRRGYRYLDELDDLNRSASLLGTLPDLDSPSEEDNQLAALAVHHIRNMLHVLSPGQPGRGRVFAVTSASAGEGKTSLSLALGMSFAVAGQRTLMIDADLIGRGLSAQLDMDQKRGISEAVASTGEIEAFIHKTGRDDLWCIPAGVDRGFNPERLSEAHIDTAISTLRDRFDTIIIDTGPILGSLEADIVTAVADRVVMAISRGQSPKLVKASLSRLRHLGARGVGLVFNRATHQDMTKSISHVSIHSQSIRHLPDGTVKSRRRITPLALAVADKPREGDAEEPAVARKNGTSGAW